MALLEAQKLQVTSTNKEVQLDSTHSFPNLARVGTPGAASEGHEA